MLTPINTDGVFDGIQIEGLSLFIITLADLSFPKYPIYKKNFFKDEGMKTPKKVVGLDPQTGHTLRIEIPNF